jgi:uncharacterized membrane protein YdjX (TVP38/TMEM64 family)
MWLLTLNLNLSASLSTRNDAPLSLMEKKKQLDSMPAYQDGRSGMGEGPLAGPQMAKAHPALTTLKRFGPLAGLGAVMLLVLGMGWHREVTLENIVALRDRFHHVLDAHKVVSVVLYIAFYICVVALSLPGAFILTAAAGLLFGCWLGGLVAVIGATVGATLLFLVARSALGEGLTARAGPWLAKLREGFREDALSYLLFLRLVPAFPFWFVNIAPAILGVSLRTYVVATFFGIIPATFAFAAAGAGLDSVIVAAKAEYAACVALKGQQACKLSIHASSLVTKELVLALALLGLVALIPVAIRKWRSAHAAAK